MAIFWRNIAIKLKFLKINIYIDYFKLGTFCHSFSAIRWGEKRKFRWKQRLGKASYKHVYILIVDLIPE